MCSSPGRLRHSPCRGSTCGCVTCNGEVRRLHNWALEICADPGHIETSAEGGVVREVGWEFKVGGAIEHQGYVGVAGEIGCLVRHMRRVERRWLVYGSILAKDRGRGWAKFHTGGDPQDFGRDLGRVVVVGIHEEDQVGAVQRRRGKELRLVVRLCKSISIGVNDGTRVLPHQPMAELSRRGRLEIPNTWGTASYCCSPRCSLAVFELQHWRAGRPQQW